MQVNYWWMEGAWGSSGVPELTLVPRTNPKASLLPLLHSFAYTRVTDRLSTESHQAGLGRSKPIGPFIVAMS